jgi:hypothetical protein
MKEELVVIGDIPCVVIQLEPVCINCIYGSAGAEGLHPQRVQAFLQLRVRENGDLI